MGPLKVALAHTEQQDAPKMCVHDDLAQKRKPRSTWKLMGWCENVNQQMPTRPRTLRCLLEIYTGTPQQI